MRRKLDTEMKAGIFISLGLVIFMITVLMMGGGKAIFDTFYPIKLEVADAGGLAKGATVRSGGLKIGRVEDISFTGNYTSVVITLMIDTSYRERIRQDSLVRFQTQGVLGDKYLEITGGSPDQPVIADGGNIQAEVGKDLGSMLAEGGNAVQLLKENLANLKVITGSMAEKNRMANILKDLESTTAALKDVSQSLKSANVGHELGATMKNLRAVSEKVKNGEGTIGALFSDASLYEDLKHLIGGANRNNVLKFFVRQAVKSSDDAAAAKSAEEQKAKDAKPAKK